MRQLLVACAAVAALLASHNSAEAVFVKVVIDNFDEPSAPDPVQISMPGSTTESISGVLADSRTLTGANGVLTAGNGELQINLQSNTSAEMVLGLSGANMLFAVADPVIFMTGVSGAFGAMSVEAFFGATSLGIQNVVGGVTATDLQWTVGSVDAMNGADELRFVFATGETGFFGGSAQDVVANPEPATMALMGLGVLGGAIGYRRRRKDDEVAPVEG